MKKLCFMLLLLLSVLLFSCHSYPPDIPPAVKNVLKKAGENRTELIRVIEHYQSGSDSLKLQAAYFLIGNMEYKYSDYYAFVEPFLAMYQADREAYNDRRSVYYELSQQRLDSILNIYDTEAVRSYDMETITADYLIKNIELSFQMWSEPWARRFGFDAFCEYILPYRIHNEPLSDWREAFIKKYYWVIDSVANRSDTEEIALYLNDLVGDGFRGDEFGLPLPAVTALDTVKIGACADRYFLVTHVLRAMGIPAMIDYAPQNDHTFKSHQWTVYLDTLFRYRPFDGGDTRSVLFQQQESPRSAFPENTVIPLANGFGSNVYRYTYSVNKNSLAEIWKKKKPVPPLFQDPCLKNVTELYEFEMYDTELDLAAYQVRNNELVYLSVFGYGDDLREADWGRVKNRKVHFQNIGANIVYLLCRYADDRLIPFSDPFILTADDNPKLLTPDTIHRREVALTRKCNISPQMLEFAGNMVGAMFQGSDFEDFRKVDTLFTITSAPHFLVEQKVDSDKPYRYVRYYSPDFGIHVAEIHFVGKNEKGEAELLLGEIISNHQHAEKENPANFCDTNVRTNYNADAGGWIGFAFETPRFVHQVEYLARNNWNIMEPDNVYELFYYDRRWISLGQSTTRNQYLKIANVPSKGLFLLRNRTQGKEERIFTYENEQQVWW